MSNTILRTVGTQSVAFEFNSLADAHTYAATAEHALRDAKARLAHAKKLTADAFARLPANHGTVKDEFFDLVDRYFKMPRPVGMSRSMLNFAE